MKLGDQRTFDRRGARARAHSPPPCSFNSLITPRLNQEFHTLKSPAKVSRHWGAPHSIRALFGEDDERKMVPINASRLDPAKSSYLVRREERIRLVRGRIKEAVGESRDQQRCADKQEEV